MVWLTIAIVLVLLLVILLVTKICVEIDTTIHLYRVSWGKVVRGSVVPSEDDFYLQLFIFGYQKKWSLLRILVKNGNKKAKAKNEKTKRKTRSNFSARTAFDLLKSFRVKKLHLNIDLNNAIWNAWLYPVGYFISKNNIQCTTNFEGRNELILEIVNRPIWLVHQFIKTSLKNT